jgi:uncharacterized protein YcbK (DUF882 family)
MTPHFSWREFACNCGCVAPAFIHTKAATLAMSLEALRAEVKRPVRVISGYRCTKRNAAIGGAPASRHLEGDAADVQVEGFTGRQLRDLVEGLIALGKMREGGLGTYTSKPATLHYDCRGTKARWHKP